MHAEAYSVDKTHFPYLSPIRYKYINRLGKYSSRTRPNGTRFTAAHCASPVTHGLACKSALLEEVPLFAADVSAHAAVAEQPVQLGRAAVLAYYLQA